MTERVIKSCGRDDNEEPKFVANQIHKDNYNFFATAASEMQDRGVAAALLALASQLARIADVIEFAAETEAVF